MIKIINKIINKRSKDHSREIFHLIFPDSHSTLCDFIASHIREKFHINCVAIKYSKLDRKTIRLMSDEINNSQILAIGFRGTINIETAYKLGIAQHRENHILLVNLCPLKTQDYDPTSIPNFIRYHFLLLYEEGEGSSQRFLSQLEKIIEVLLSKCLASTLYHKALSICKTFEDQYLCTISKLNEENFKFILSASEEHYLKELFLRYMNDDEDLCSELLYMIISDKLEIMNLLRSKQPLENFPEGFKDIESYFLNNGIKIDMTTNTTSNHHAVNYIMTDNKTTNFNLPYANIGAIATDNAQATVTENTFTQNHNTSTEDLLKLITALRQTSVQFPTEIKEEIDSDLEDLEAEIIKPETDRNPTRIKKRIAAIVTTIGILASGVSGLADFTNTTIDLGEKLNIDVPALMGR